jgi:uncharacterized coiled-coil protein SlyX
MTTRSKTDKQVLSLVCSRELLGYNRHVMGKQPSLIPTTLMVAAGMAVGGAVAAFRRAGAPPRKDALRPALAELEHKMAARHDALEDRLTHLESRIDQHEEKLKDVPSTAGIVAAMEQLLSHTMDGLDRRLSDQAKSIEVLKTTVSQTDELLERVLDSIHSLQPALEADRRRAPVAR